MGEAAANRSPCSNRDVGNVLQSIGQERQPLAHDRARLGSTLPGHGADPDASVANVQPDKPVDVVQIDEKGGASDPEIEQRQQALTTGKQTHVPSSIAE